MRERLYSALGYLLPILGLLFLVYIAYLFIGYIFMGRTLPEPMPGEWIPVDLPP